MHTKLTAPLALALIIGGTLVGCATAEVPAAGPAATSAEAPAEAPADTETTDAAGSYLDYRDGIIADTAGDKVLFFYASWCPKCRAVEESIKAGNIPEGLTIIKVDFDNSTELRQKYGVTQQTTVVFVDDDGAELSTEVLYDDTSLDALLAAAP